MRANVRRGCDFRGFSRWPSRIAWSPLSQLRHLTEGQSSPSPDRARLSISARLRGASGLLCLLAAGAQLNAQDSYPTLELAASAVPFELKGVDGAVHRLSDYAEAKLLMVVFMANHCPDSQEMEAPIKELVRDFADEGLQVVAISGNDPKAVDISELGYSLYGDTFEEMKLHADRYGFNFPYLYDGDTQEVTRAYGAVATPHVFLFDEGRKLRYRGRVEARDGGERDARAAVEALLAGEPVPNPSTRPFGCSIKWSHKRDWIKSIQEAWEAQEVTVDPIDAAGLAELRANPNGRLRLINVWATWCGPCVQEMPMLVRLSRQFDSRGLDLITVSMDRRTWMDRVEIFLNDYDVGIARRARAAMEREGRQTNHYLFAGSDPDALAEALDPQWPGALPHTILIAENGEVLYRHTGIIDEMTLREIIIEHAGRVR